MPNQEGIGIATFFGVPIYSEVNTFADLPAAADCAGQIHIVRTTTGVWFVNRRRRGLWRSDGIVWTRMGIAPTRADMGLGVADSPVFAGVHIGANTLDDYEEGNWVPDLQFGGAKVGVIYGNRGGGYTKIGRLVTLSCFIQLTNKGTSVGNATIEGLPFPVLNSDHAVAAPSFSIEAISFADWFHAYVWRNTSSIQLVETTNAGIRTTITNGNFSNGSQLIMGLSYIT